MKNLRCKQSLNFRGESNRDDAFLPAPTWGLFMKDCFFCKHIFKTENNKQNCILTIKNDKLGGILTERDILLKVTGKGYDLDLTVIDEFITTNPEFVTPEDPLAYALNKMHIGGFRNVPVVNDELYPIGIISITDIVATIADYFHNEIINLPPLDKLVDRSTLEGG